MMVFGFAGSSSFGKTSLIEQLNLHLVQEGPSVSQNRHALAGFDFERPGKDCFRPCEAGSTGVLPAAIRVGGTPLRRFGRYHLAA